MTGLVEGKRAFGQQIEVRCWDSLDARTATPTRLGFPLLERLAAEILREVPGVVSVTYSITPKAALHDRSGVRGWKAVPERRRRARTPSSPSCWRSAPRTCSTTRSSR